MRRLLLPSFVLSFCALGCWDDILTVDSTSLHAREIPEHKKVAVLDFAGKGGQAVADLMTMNLFKAGYEVVERDRLRELIFEQQIGAGGYKRMSDVEKARRLGRILNADLIFTGELIALGSPVYRRPIFFLVEDPTKQVAYSQARMEIVARAFDARTGEIVWLGRANVTCKAGRGKWLGIMDFISKPCAELTRAFGDPGYKGISVVRKNQEIGPAIF